MNIKESFTRKISNTKNQDILNKSDEMNFKEFITSLKKSLESKGIHGIEVPYDPFKKVLCTDTLKPYIGQTIYIDAHKDDFVKFHFYLVHVFEERTIEEDDVENEDDFAVLKARNVNLNRICCIGLGVHDYRVFGGNDTDIQIEIFSTNNLDQEEFDFKGYFVEKWSRGEEPFSFLEDKNSIFTSSGHYKPSRTLFGQFLQRCLWIDYASSVWEEYIKDAYGFYNGENILEHIIVHMNKNGRYKIKPISESFTRKTAKKNVADIESQAQKQGFFKNKVEKYKFMISRLYETFKKNGFEDVNNLCHSCDAQVGNDSLLRNMIQYYNPQEELKMPTLTLRRYMEMPFDLLMENSRSKGYYAVGGSQIRGERFNIEIEIRPKYVSSTGGHMDWWCHGDKPFNIDEVNVKGFVIKMNFDVNCWELKDGQRQYKHVNRNLSNSFRLVPDTKKGFKIVLGERRESDRESIWEIESLDLNYVVNMIYPLFKTMDDDSFRKQFLEPLFKFDRDGPTYQEYISKPKYFNNFIEKPDKARLEYLKSSESNFTFYIHNNKLERFLFDELIRNNQKSILVESFTKKISKRTERNIIDIADEGIMSMEFPEFIANIEEFLEQNNSSFEYCDSSLYYFIRDTVLSEKMDKDAFRMLKKKCYYHIFDYNDDDKSVCLWKPFMSRDGKSYLIVFYIKYSLERDVEKKKRRFDLEVQLIGKGVNNSVFFKMQDGVIKGVETGKHVDYHSETTLKNLNAIKKYILSFSENYKILAGFYNEWQKVNNLRDEIIGIGDFKRPAKKSRKLEIEKELEIVFKYIKRKYRETMDLKNFYSYTCIPLKFYVFEKFLFGV